MVEIHIWSDDRYHSIYENYPEHPYCSPRRTKYSYSKEFKATVPMLPFRPVLMEAMIRLDCGLLLGHIKLMWRLSLNYWNEKTRIPAYFEYRYGIDVKKELSLLISKRLAFEDTEFISGKSIIRLTSEGYNLYKKYKPSLDYFEEWTIYKVTCSKENVCQTDEVIQELILDLSIDEYFSKLLSKKEIDPIKLKKTLLDEKLAHYERPRKKVIADLSENLRISNDVASEVMDSFYSRIKSESRKKRRFFKE